MTYANGIRRLGGLRAVFVATAFIVAGAAVIAARLLASPYATRGPVMKLFAAILASMSLITWSAAHAGGTRTPEDMQMVAPALEKYQETTLLGGVWKRPGLSPRDRSLVTLSALIARNQAKLPFYLALALDNGVKPAEISETITHLAFYSGWANATAAIAVAKEVFTARKIGADQIPSASPAPLPLNEARENKMRSTVLYGSA
jgi:4-carboxymuconolactone decarboxylase